jgi:hypothetical protein
MRQALRQREGIVSGERVGWTTGLEPATTGITIQDSTN